MFEVLFAPISAKSIMNDDVGSIASFYLQPRQYMLI